MSDLEMLLAVTMWMAWTVRSAQKMGGTEASENLTEQISIVSPQRLRELGPRLETELERMPPSEVHQVIRFNLYNFGERPITVASVELTSLASHTLPCKLTPSVVIAPGARWPVMVETMKGPVGEVVRVEVDVRGRRSWVSVQSLPRA